MNKLINLSNNISIYLSINELINQLINIYLRINKSIYLCKDELDELRGRGRGRRTLTFGFTDYEVDLALQEIEDIEVGIVFYFI